MPAGSGSYFCRLNGYNSQQDRQYTCKHNIGAHSWNHCSRGKAGSNFTHWECVHNLSYSTRKAQALYLSVACPALQCCSKLPYKRQDIRGKKVTEHKMCLIFSSTFIWHISHSKKNLLIYLLTAIGLSPGGSSTVHIYTQTVHRTTQNKKYIVTTQQFGKVRAVPRLG